VLGYVAAHPWIAIAATFALALIAIQAFMDLTDDEYWR
jgi:hypothetical protein